MRRTFWSSFDAISAATLPQGFAPQIDDGLYRSFNLETAGLWKEHPAGNVRKGEETCPRLNAL